jgi:plastocyanin
MTRNSRIALLAAAAVVAVVAIVIIGSGGSDKKDSSTAAQTAATAGTQTSSTATTPPKPAIPAITIKHGKAVGGVQTVTVKAGDRVRFKVVSDAAHEIHLHGLDIAKKVNAGGSVTFDVKSNAPGIYEFEIEDTKTKIGQVKVEP